MNYKPDVEMFSGMIHLRNHWNVWKNTMQKSKTLQSSLKGAAKTCVIQIQGTKTCINSATVSGAQTKSGFRSVKTSVWI